MTPIAKEVAEARTSIVEMYERKCQFSHLNATIDAILPFSDPYHVLVPDFIFTLLRKASLQV